MLRLTKKYDVGLVWEKTEKRNKINVILLFLAPLKLYCYFIKWDNKINKVIFCDVKLLNTKCRRSQG